MSRIRIIAYTIFFLILLTNLGYTQTTDTTTTTTDVTSSAGSDFVDLTGEGIVISPEPERPRVNIIVDRIKPEFETIDLEKSFLPELTGRGERIVVIPRGEGNEIKLIDIEKTLNRSR